MMNDIHPRGTDRSFVIIEIDSKEEQHVVEILDRLWFRYENQLKPSLSEVSYLTTEIDFPLRIERYDSVAKIPKKISDFCENDSLVWICEDERSHSDDMPRQQSHTDHVKPRTIQFVLIQCVIA